MSAWSNLNWMCPRGPRHPYLLDDDLLPVCLICDWEKVVGDGCIGLITTPYGQTKRCQYRAVIDPVFRLCPKCLEQVQIGVDGARQRREAEEEAWRESVRQRLRNGVVYYIERGGFIKIGHSTDLRARIRAIETTGGVLCPDGAPVIGPVTLLAQHGGGFAAESAMHSRFSHLRVRGEWFSSGEDLLRHIAAINVRQTERRVAA